MVKKALNENSSQHAFKKIKRKFGQNDPLILEYCSNLIKLQVGLMDRKHKTAVANMKIISDNYGSNFTNSSISNSFSSSKRGSIYSNSVVGGEGPSPFGNMASVSTK